MEQAAYVIAINFQKKNIIFNLFTAFAWLAYGYDTIEQWAVVEIAIWCWYWRIAHLNKPEIHHSPTHNFPNDSIIKFLILFSN